MRSYGWPGQFTPRFASGSPLADNNSFEQWEADGGQDAARSANTLCRRMLADCEPPPVDPAIDEALTAFIANKKASMPDAFV